MLQIIFNMTAYDILLLLLTIIVWISWIIVANHVIMLISDKNITASGAEDVISAQEFRMVARTIIKPAIRISAVDTRRF